MSNMVVRTNVFALNAHRNMKNVGLEQSRASNRLSSGYRINSAADDAAGLAISETMRAQIRGLDQASRNAQDGQSMLLTTEGGLEEIGNMLQRVRELLVQASNDTNTQDQRRMIEQEIGQLSQEIGSMQQRVEFNTNRVLAMGPALDSQVSVNMATLEVDSQRVSEAFSRIEDNRRDVIEAREMLNALAGTTNFDDLNARQQTLVTRALGDVIFSDIADDDGDSYAVGDVFRVVSDASTVSWGNSTYADATLAVSVGSLTGEGQVAGNPGIFIVNVTEDEYIFNTAADGSGLTLELEEVDGVMSWVVAELAEADGDDEVDFSEFSVTELIGHMNDRLTALQNASTELNVIRAAMNVTADGIFDSIGDFRDATSTGSNIAFFQVGANANQGIQFDLEDVSRAVSSAAAIVNVAAILVANPDSGGGIGRGVEISPLIAQLQTSLDDIASVRANLGAVQNRMDYTMRSLDISSENLQDSESRVRNADVAREMMRFTMANVLQQAAVSMLSQANQMPNNLLQLLR